MKPPASLDSRDDRRVAAALGLLLAAIYLATSAFQFHSIDEFAIFTVTRNLVTRGSIDGDVLYWARSALGQGSVVAPGIGGHTYIAKDVLTSILALPAVWLASHSGIDGERMSLLITPLITAITVSVLYLVARSWGIGRRGALVAGFAYGLGTIAWPYAETLFTQPVGALGLLLALHGTIRARAGGGWQSALLAGVGLGVAGVSALPAWVTLPIYPLAWVIGVPPREWFRKPMLTKLAAFGIGAGAFLLMLMAYNVLRFGGPLNTGHREIGAANFRLLHMGVGVFGQVFSTPRGLVWYVPPTLLIPFGVWIGWKSRLRGHMALALAQFGILFGLISGYASWWAGLSWGPRYLTPVMPALILLTTPLLDRVFDGKPGESRWWERLLIGMVLGTGLLTQLMGSVFDTVQTDVPLIGELGKITPPPAFFFRAPILTDPAALPLSRQMGAARQGLWDLLALSQGNVDWLLLAAQSVVITAGVAVLIGAWRGDRRVGRWGIGVQAALTVGLCALIMMRHPAEGQQAEGVRSIAAAVDQAAQPQDGLLLQLPESIFDWMRIYEGEGHDIGIMPEDPLSEETDALLNRLASWHDRIWFIEEGTFTGDPTNGAQRWLAEHAYAGTGSVIEGIRITPYTFWQGEEAASEQVTNAQFGDEPILLTGYAVESVNGSTGKWINVRLKWAADRTPLADYSVFVHVLDEGGNLVAQHDGTPGAGYAPTTTWQAGQLIVDQHSLLLPDDLPAGEYVLEVGLYDPRNGERLPLAGGGDSLTLTHLNLSAQ